MLAPFPGFRLSPARFWKHRTGGLLPIPSGDHAFDSRWLLLAAEDGPQVRRLAGDPTVQGLLLDTDDGDEFWSAAGHVAAIRPDGHRPQLIEHHARLLTAVVGCPGRRRTEPRPLRRGLLRGAHQAAEHAAEDDAVEGAMPHQ